MSEAYWTWQCKIQHSKVVCCNSALKLPIFVVLQAVSASHYLRNWSGWTCRTRCHVGEATSDSAPQTSSRASESPPAHSSLPESVPALRSQRILRSPVLPRPACATGSVQVADLLCRRAWLESFQATAKRHSWKNRSGTCSGFVRAKRQPAASVCQRRAEGVKATPG